jgi:nitroreductase
MTTSTVPQWWAEHLSAVVEAATRAPSSHNAQPWRFRLHGDALELHADRSRALPVADPKGREMLLACGAALLHVRLAVAHLGRAAQVTLLPTGAGTDLLARVVPAGPRTAAPDDEELHDAIPRRRMNRYAFTDEPLPRSVTVALADEADREGAELRLAERPGLRRALADLVVTADRAQSSDPAFRAELAGWARPAGSGEADGVPASAYGMSARSAQAAPFVLRDFGAGSDDAGGGPDRPDEAPEREPAILVLVTPGDGPADWLRAGQAMERVLLRATVLGVSASFLNQPLELPGARSRVREELGVPGHPQIVMRLGVGREVPPTPRRPVVDVLDREAIDDKEQP